MSYHWSDSLYTAVFTPRDYQVELLATAFERNTLICLGHKSSKEFIALKLLQELHRLKGKRLKAVYLSCQNTDELPIHNLVEHHTNFNVFHMTESDKALPENNYQMFIMHPKAFLNELKVGHMTIEDLHLLILEDCHKVDELRELVPIFRDLFVSKKGSLPKILGLGGPLHNASCLIEELDTMINILERNVYSKIETASDIVTVLRYCSKPIEYIVQCAPYSKDELTLVLEEIIISRKNFLIDHRYDPFEIYNTPDFLEELKDIPDPKKDPIEFLDTILCVLYEMGPWAADRVATNMFFRIEKQKVKTPHERHFILLCVVNTALIEIHAICENTFKNFTNHKTLIEQYSSPKVLRLLELLRLFTPEEFSTKNETIKNISSSLEDLDFQKLTRSLENSCQNVENMKQKLESQSIIENLDPIIKEKTSERHTTQNTIKNNGKLNSINHRFKNTNNTSAVRTKRKPPLRRQLRRDLNAEADTLCAIIFCNSSFTAKILFNLLTDISHYDSDLKFIKSQFITDRTSNPLTEPKEAESEHRRQEEVLKRFRMHDCNVLIGTTLLEEGIDVPKCNLVIRWDPPTTYRSYVQCKGKARSTPSYHFTLVAPKFDTQLNNSCNLKTDQLSEIGHKFLCQLPQSEESLSDSRDSDSSNDENCSYESTRSHFHSKQITIDSSKGTIKILNPEVITGKLPISADLSYDCKTQIIDSLTKENTRCLTDTDTCIVENNICTYNGAEKYNISTEILEEGLSDEQCNNFNETAKKSAKVECYVQGDKTAVDNKEILYSDKLIEMEMATDEVVERLAKYREIEKMLLLRCANKEPMEIEQHLADKFCNCIETYKPLSHLLTSASVDLNTSISLVNKYCSKLPSDTFTKLTPLWRCASTTRNGVKVYQYTIRLPINSPLKYDIVGLPMSTHILARRIAALQTCIELHRIGELDNNLQPIGKEGFRAIEPDWENFNLEEQDEKIVHENIEPRPGTTKRRQYYYKRIASEFCDCRPIADTVCYLYILDLTLQCPIPEEQNTRGRKIYPPEDALQGFGILTLKKIPKISSFPIFTRSGEVKVSLNLSKQKVILTEEQIVRINSFLNYIFTNVLRLQKFLMLFDPDSTENCVFIVPTTKKPNGEKTIDWEFLELILKNANILPKAVSEEERATMDFQCNKFKDAVVMPWYRNQDQPQYFYVAEICSNLSPLSSFPGESYTTFKHYYSLKYSLNIQNTNQPLLDVDHTSARLNFLTPRYVNRKGVALPTSSEETKKAKRENLEQKQILVPELCTVHPFPASLWRTAVCLPCILYRINGLLLADDIRRKVAADIGIGKLEISDDFEWPSLDFGWSLSEVLNKSKTNRNNSKLKVNDVEKLESLPTRDEDMELEQQDTNDLILSEENKSEDNDFIEIGTWSNEMANNIPKANGDLCDDNENDFISSLPSNISLCPSQLRYGSPTFLDIKQNNFNIAKNSELTYTENKDVTHLVENSFEYFDSDGSMSSNYNDNPDDFFCSDEDDFSDLEHIAYISKNEAEAFESEQDIEKRRKKLFIIQESNANERAYQETKNLKVGYNFIDFKENIKTELESAVEKFSQSTECTTQDIKNSKMLVKYQEPLVLPKHEVISADIRLKPTLDTILQMIPYANEESIKCILDQRLSGLTIKDIADLNLNYVSSHKEEVFSIAGCGDIFDNFNDKNNIEIENFDNETNLVTKNIKLSFEEKELWDGKNISKKRMEDSQTFSKSNGFSFDYQPNLNDHPGPSPSIILQALTMSNANDGINLERLETIGDSFLKYAITTYLYITYENVHEGKLSHLRSKQVANLNLYRLGRQKILGEYMIATKFEPHDNWLPPCYYVPKELEKALIEAKIPPRHWKLVDLPNIKKLNSAEICQLVREKAEQLGLFDEENNSISDDEYGEDSGENDFTCFIPYNLVTQHSIPDKSIADCVEALIGAYLIECGSRGALIFMAWLGIRVIPFVRVPHNPKDLVRVPGSTKPDIENFVTIYGEWNLPKSPLLHYCPNAEDELTSLLTGYDEFEKTLGYKFHDRSYLLQAMSHASYTPNRLTDCYQRLEFLGDAVLDYLITRHLYEDPRQHSPGALTDLRSALVNNTIFASLAVRHGFHKYFLHLSPGLNEVIDRFVRIQNENGHSISEEYYVPSDDDCDDAEDVEVPKALGDVFESVAGAIFLDSNMSLDTVWKVYSNMMKPEIEMFSNSVPKSPIRELLELEPETAKFSKPEKLADGRRVRVTVEVFCKGIFRGIGRNYRIAKCTAAKCALRQLRKKGLISKKD